MVLLIEWSQAGRDTRPSAGPDDLRPDVWQAAILLVKRYGDDAMLEAEARAEQFQEHGDLAGAETWHRILNAIEWLQARAPAEAVH
jgi:hypothetical protein